MTPNSDDVFFASITELNQKLTNKEFSAVELTRAFCDRLESIGPRYNALALSLRKDRSRRRQGSGWRHQARTSARPAARHSFRRQGSALVRQTSHHLGREAVRGPSLQGNRQRAQAPAETRRIAHRQTRHGGTRGRPQLSLCQRIAHRPGLESVGQHALVRWFFQWLSHRGGSRPGHLRARLGNVRLHPYAQRFLRRYRTAPDLWTGVAEWGHVTVLDAR